MLSLVRFRRFIAPLNCAVRSSSLRLYHDDRRGAGGAAAGGTDRRGAGGGGAGGTDRRGAGGGAGAGADRRGGAGGAAAAAAGGAAGAGGGSTRRYCTAPPGSSSRSCWRCQEALQEQPAFLCGRCGAVQPADQTASHFRTLGCDPSFSLDTQKLQKRYLQLQRSLHPDNFSQSTKEEQEYSEQQSAMLNTAYRTLLKPLSRGLYMLELQGMPIEEGTISAADPALLMELMEVNEAVEEARTVEEAGRIGQDTRVRLAELTTQIDGALRRGEHEDAKVLLIQMKYFATVEEKVKERISKLM